MWHTCSKVCFNIVQHDTNEIELDNYVRNGTDSNTRSNFDYMK